MYNRVHKDVTFDDNMKMVVTENKIPMEEIILKDIDIRRFWVDNEAIKDFDLANDCIYEEWESFSNFQRLKDSAIYKNVDKVVPCDYSNEYDTYHTDEDL